MRFFGYLVLSLILAALCSGETGDCAGQWVEFSHRPYEEAAFPDTHVTYYRYQFRLEAGQNIKFKVTGKFPTARYMTFNLYEQAEKASLGTVPDTTLVVDGEKSYRAPKAGDAYTIYLTTQTEAGVNNQLPLPKADTSLGYELWYRIYQAVDGDKGAQSLPQIQAQDVATGAPVACPAASPLKIVPDHSAKNLRRLPPPPKEDNIAYFYTTKGMGYYNNGDNDYLIAKMDFAKGYNYVLLHFRAPITPGTANYTGQAKPDMRYWSICMNSAYSTQVSGCLADSEMKISPTGEVTLLIGPEQIGDRSVKELAAQKGINFLDKGKNFMPVVIYRNVLTDPDFKGRVNLDYAWPPEAGTDRDVMEVTHRQANYIGEYAPQGKRLTDEETLSYLSGN